MQKLLTEPTLSSLWNAVLCNTAIKLQLINSIAESLSFVIRHNKGSLHLNLGILWFRFWQSSNVSMAVSPFWNYHKRPFKQKKSFEVKVKVILHQLLSYSCMFQVEICSQQLEICKSVCMFIVLAIVVETD